MEKRDFKLITDWLDEANYFFACDREYNKIPEERMMSLKDLTMLMQTAYSKFKEEYSGLEKLAIGENNNVVYYVAEDGFRMLNMVLSDQKEGTIVPEDSYYLSICDRHGNLELSFQDANSIASGNGVTVDNVDPRILNGYLDLFGRYYPMFELFIDYGCDFLADHNNQYLTMNMVANNDSLINGLIGVEFNVQNFSEMGNNFIVKLYVDLRDGVNIDYNRCEIIVNDSPKKAYGFGFKEIIDHVFENIRFDRSSLEDYGFVEFAQNLASLEPKTNSVKTIKMD